MITCPHCHRQFDEVHWYAMSIREATAIAETSKMYAPDCWRAIAVANARSRKKEDTP